jgi:signal transduction histidine kinase
MTCATVSAAVVVLLVGVTRAHGLTDDAPTVRASLESLIALCGAVAVGLQWSRFTVTHELRDLFLIGATAVLTVAGVFAYALPAVLGLGRSGGLAAMASSAFFFASVGFWLAARSPAGALAPARSDSRLLSMTFSISALAVLVACAVGLTADARLTRSSFALASGALLLYAAFASWRRATGGSKDGERWLAGGLGLLATGQLYAVTLPLLAPGWVSAREPLRLAGVGMILVAALIAERQARLTLARLAVIAERQRVARDLHDGIAQDLAFIAAHAGTLPRLGHGEHPVGIAARRALAVSRGVIDDLSDLDSRSLQEALAVLATELSERFAISVKIEAAGNDGLALDVRHDLMRIVREAVSNAVKHGGASNVTVAIEHSAAGTVLRVRDDGAGLTGGDGERPPEGFGLTNMRERAAAIGARVALNEHVGGGAEVEVALR